MIQGMTGQETEVKFYVRQLKRVERRLQALGARLIQTRVHEVNLRLDLPDGSLRREEQVLRLRQDTQARLTYKGPSQQTDGVLLRAEVEITVDNFEAARSLLKALGYIPVATYEKYRSTYELGELHIMLDELPYGDFVEIEGPDVESLKKTVEKLGLDFSTAIPINYLALFERLCQIREFDSTKLTFKALKGIKVRAEELSVLPADS